LSGLGLPDLKAVVVSVLTGKETGLGFGEIVEEVQVQQVAAPSAVRQALHELEDERRVIPFPEREGSAGRPKYIYKLVDPASLQQQPVLRDAVEESKSEEFKLARSLVQGSTGRYSTLPPEGAKKIYDEAAHRLLNENPIDLFFRFGEWLHGQHSKAVADYVASKNKGQNKATQSALLSTIESVEELGDRIFNRLLGVPQQIRDASGNASDGPYSLAFVERTLTDDSHYDPNVFRAYLELAILGNHVFEPVDLAKPTPPIHIGGSDASLQPIDVASVLPWHAESQEIDIVTAIGVRYDIFSGAREVDRQPEPRVLAQYERRQAIEEGLLVPPPAMLGVDEAIHERIKEAAMDLRQYVKDHQMMFEKEPTVSVHFRDGRIFPLEHRLSDAIQRGVHGEIVRAALKVFRNVVNNIGAEGGKILYVGYVKRVQIPMIKHLFFWYVGFGSGSQGAKPIDPGMSTELLLREPTPDSVIMNNLFASLREISNDTYVTFRVIRRFQTMEEDFMRTFEPSTDTAVWTERLGKVADQWLNTDPRHAGVDLISTLCSRASVLEFYSNFPKQLDPNFESSVSIPRIELLVPYPDLVSDSKGHRPIQDNEKGYVSRILGTMLYEGVLELYPDELNPMGRSPRVFLAPRSVVEAHEGCKLIAQVYRDDFLDLLVREAKIYWMEIHGAAGPPLSR
jgi:hypothetical protein